MFSSEQLQKLIYPLIIEQVLAITVGTVDTVMISYAGESAMSGVSLVDMINTLMINIFIAVSTGGAVILSQYLGSKNTKQASKAAGAGHSGNRRCQRGGDVYRVPGEAGGSILSEY